MACVARGAPLVLRRDLMSVDLLDAAGRRRPPAGYRRGCVPRNKGRGYSADPPRVEEIIAASSRRTLPCPRGRVR